MPNLLSSYRIVLTPLVILLITLNWQESRAWVAGLTATAALSDWLDGFIARRYHISTEFGALLDWLADQVYVLSVLIALVGVGSVPAWVAVIFVAREIVIIHVSDWSAARGFVLPVRPLGKFKMLTSMFALFAVSLGAAGGEWVLYAALALSVASGADYVVLYMTRPAH